MPGTHHPQIGVEPRGERAASGGSWPASAGSWPPAFAKLPSGLRVRLAVGVGTHDGRCKAGGGDIGTTSAVGGDRVVTVSFRCFFFGRDARVGM